MSLINDMLQDLERRQGVADYPGLDGSGPVRPAYVSDGLSATAALQGLGAAESERSEGHPALRWCAVPLALGSIVIGSLTVSQQLAPADLTMAAEANRAPPALLQPGGPAGESSDLAGLTDLPATPRATGAEPAGRRGGHAPATGPMDERGSRFALSMSAELNLAALPETLEPANQPANQTATRTVEVPDEPVAEPPLEPDLQAEVDRINAQLANLAPAAGREPFAVTEPLFRKRARSAGESRAGDRRASEAQDESGSMPAARSGPVDVALQEPLVKRPIGGTRASELNERYESALALVRQGEWESAVEQLQGILTEDPAHGAAREALVVTLSRHGRLAQALELTEEAVQLEPEVADWWFKKTRLLVELGRHQEALDTLSSMPVDERYAASRLAYSGAVLLEMQRPADAVTAYKKAVLAAPQEGRWWLGLGAALEASGALDQAASAYERAGAERSLQAAARQFAIRRAAVLRQN